MNGKKIAILKGDVYVKPFKNLLNKFHLKCSFVETNSYSEIFKLISEKRVEVGVVNRFFGLKSAKHYRVAQSGIIFNPIEVRFAANKKSGQYLLSVIDKDIELMKQNRDSIYYNSLYKWFYIGETNGYSYKEVVTYIALTAAFLLSVIALFFIWNYSLKRKVKQKTYELYTSAENLRITLQSIGDGVIATDLKGNVTIMNSAAEELTGWKFEDAKGKYINDIFNIVNEKTRKIVKNPVSRALKEGAVVGLANHTILISKDKKEMAITDSGAPIKDKNGNIIGVILVFKDQTKERELYKKIETLNNQLISTLKTMTDGFVALDTNWVYTYINKHGATLLGRRPEELIGKHIWTEFPESIGQPFYKNYYKAMETQKPIRMVEFYEPWQRWFENRIIPSKEGLSIFYQDITEQKLYEEELKKLSLIVEQNTNIIVVADTDGNIEYVNPAFSKATDYSQEEVIGKNSNILKSGNKSKEEYKKLWDTIKSGNVWRGEFLNKKKNGELYYESAAIFPLKNEKGEIINFVAVKEDITERKKSQQLLKESEETKRAILEAIPDAMLVLNKNGKYIDVFAGNDLLLAAQKENIVGKTIYDFIDKEKAEDIQKVIDNVLETGKTKYYEYTLETGFKLRDFSANVSKFKFKGEDCVLWLARDITERKEMINSIKEKEEIMLAQSRQAAMGEMISMIAHQWRQPLSVIAMGVNNILADIEFKNVNSDELKRIAHLILDQTKHLSNTIDDFRNFFKPRKAKEEIVPNDVIKEALKFVGKSIEAHSIKVEENFNTKTPIKTYSRELLQVVISILQNAKEAIVDRNIKDGIIAIDTYEDKENVHIKICDNAGGIDKAIINRIFEPYFSTKDEKTGTGLGLYMSKIIVEKHLKGRIFAQNSDKGACFVVKVGKGENDE